MYHLGSRSVSAALVILIYKCIYTIITRFSSEAFDFPLHLMFILFSFLPSILLSLLVSFFHLSRRFLKTSFYFPFFLFSFSLFSFFVQRDFAVKLFSFVRFTTPPHAARAKLWAALMPRGAPLCKHT